MAFSRLLLCCAGAIALVSHVSAHGGSSHQQPIEVDPDADWATRHLAEEHHIDNFDAGAFFSLHDFDNNGVWDSDEIITTYGLKDVSAKGVPNEKKEDVSREVLNLIDKNEDKQISKEEWMEFIKEGKTLPDLGLGPGHHGDDEYEYEIHHWEKYHDENTKEEDLIHPEDIEHFKKHDQMEDEAERLAALDRMPIVAQNIPQKFKRSG